MQIDAINQALIVVFGGLAVWLVSQPKPWRRWGYILGLCSQPFWMYTTIAHKQWGLMLLSGWYTYAWGEGVWHYWIKKRQ